MFMLIVSQGLWCFIIFVCKRNVMKVVRGKSKRLYSMARQLSRAMSSEYIYLVVTIGEHAQYILPQHPSWNAKMTYIYLVFSLLWWLEYFLLTSTAQPQMEEAESLDEERWLRRARRTRQRTWACRRPTTSPMRTLNFDFQPTANHFQLSYHLWQKYNIHSINICSWNNFRNRICSSLSAASFALSKTVTYTIGVTQ